MWKIILLSAILAYCNGYEDELSERQSLFNPQPNSNYVTSTFFKTFSLDNHNKLRRTINAANMRLLVWNQTLADKALEWAKYCVWEHPSEVERAVKAGKSRVNVPFQKHLGLGQNLAYRVHGDPNNKLMKDGLALAADCESSWWSENKHFSGGKCCGKTAWHSTTCRWPGRL